MDTATQMEETCCTAMCKTILELSERIEDLIAERDQQVQLECEQKLQEQQEEFDKELAFLARENQVLAAEKEKLQLEHKKSVSELKEKHAQEKGKLTEVIRMERLKVVFERSHALEKMKESYRQQLLAFEESRRQEVQDVTSRYEERLQETLHQLAEVHKLEEIAKTLSIQVDTLQQLTGEIQSLQEENVRLRREALSAECTGMVRQNAPRNRFRNRSIARHRTRIKHRATSQDQTAPTGQEYLSLQHLQT
ncbi:hypothetical protein ANANG_G00126200 [Anguilla anguilla]|uniref:DUF4515 domain-containing protein n=1 Tax=Anguilla anguilla TaxID=7936 RepID=A0A9D3RZV4_ANGAN|nr:hypothetical protein ANANG_G00126200 [Anguilla anguilla]